MAEPRHASAKPPADEKTRRQRPSPLTLIGVALMVFGLLAVAWMGWQYFGTNITSTKQITTVKQELRESWNQPAHPVAQAAGDGMALLRIPALDKAGEKYEQPIIVGTGDTDLAKGIGWYPETSRPGQVGNFAVAGHRITHGEPFARLMELKTGDKVIVETADAVYTYELTTAPKDLTVKDTDTWVLDPDPQHPGQRPSKATITLTTCTDLFASPQRSVGFGTLIDTQKKTK